MSSKNIWHDVNSPGAFFSKKTEPSDSKEVDLEEATTIEKVKQEPEVDLTKATWSKGKDGFVFEKECELLVEGQFLKGKSDFKKIYAKLFCITEDKEEDLHFEAEGFLDENCKGSIKIKLHYADEYYNRKDKEPNLKCRYKCVVRNSRGKNELKSELLEMPSDELEIFGVSV